MNPYVKKFFLRGLLFSGFGPLIAGVVYWCLSTSLPDFSLSGGQAFLGILSTYLLAFLQAGASVFNQIDHWSPLKSMFFHFSTIYLAYTLCYVVNRWIPFEPMILLIFTAIFAVTYLVIWLTVVLITRQVEKRLNQKLQA